MLQFELEETRDELCRCCGRHFSTAIGWVFRDGTAYSAYRAVFGHEHETSKAIELQIVLGNWDGDASERDLFVLFITFQASSLDVSVMDASGAAWAGVLAEPLGRQQALSHERMSEVFSLCEAIASTDRRLQMLAV
jgi:hypothetical protein